MNFLKAEIVVPALFIGAVIALAVWISGQDVTPKAGSSEIKEVCQKGVTYYQSSSGLALAVNIAGRPLGCE